MPDHALKPFWRYYGGKWRAAPLYPKPQHRVIVEPFAGAAGYSCRYPDHDVCLVEKYPVIAAMWRYLIAVSAAEVRAIPETDNVDDLPAWVPQEARWLIGFHLDACTYYPKRRVSPKRAERLRATGHRIGWTDEVRERVASQVDRIRHWNVIEGEYWSLDGEATWFIDPPYSGPKGAYYMADGWGARTRGASTLDYAELGAWCRSRRGQVIVCENEGATWLPFVPFREVAGGFLGRPKSTEVVWLS
jgi:hypothetical protein